MKYIYFLRIKYKQMLKKFFLIPSFCKQCGRDVHDFIVEDYIWERVHNHTKKNVLCYDCFCENCEEIGIFPVWRLEELD